MSKGKMKVESRTTTTHTVDMTDEDIEAAIRAYLASAYGDKWLDPMNVSIGFDIYSEGSLRGARVVMTELKSG